MNDLQSKTGIGSKKIFLAIIVSITASASAFDRLFISIE